MSPHQYSVFDHSIAAAILQLRIDRGKIRPIPFFAALFHEVGEVVWGDIPTPFKRLCPQIAKVERAIYQNLWVNIGRYLKGVDVEIAARVDCKRVDSLLCYVEAERVLGLLPSIRDSDFATDEPPEVVRYAETIVDAMIHVHPDRSARVFSRFWHACKGLDVRGNPIKNRIRQFVNGILT
ncbi:MAG: hypothetical protein MJH10_10850 [Epibacterium sp.]|nr:hypothetical protein [Epibacterium sp.]NQX74041.1 hypothetical protein [Epibacterium sp.]